MVMKSPEGNNPGEIICYVHTVHALQWVGNSFNSTVSWFERIIFGYKINDLWKRSDEIEVSNVMEQISNHLPQVT